MALNLKNRNDYLTGLGLRYSEGDGDSSGAWLSDEGNRINNMDSFDNRYDDYVHGFYRDNYLGGRDEGLGSFMDLDRIISQMTDSAKVRGVGASIDPVRQEQILRAAAQGGFNHYTDLAKYLNPTEMQGFNQWKQWSDEQNASMSFGDYLAQAAFALGTGAVGGAAFGMGPIASASGTAGSGGVFGASAPWATGADAAWGVNPASGASEGLTLGGEAPWYSNMPSFGDPLTAAGVNGGATSAASSLANLGSAGMGLTGGAGLGAIPQIAGGAGAGSGAFNIMDAIKSIAPNLAPNATGTDWAKALSALGTAGIGAYAGNQQMDSYNQLSDKMLGMGQPYRDRLNATYDPNWSFADTPDMQRSSQAAMDQMSRSLSAKFGNPADSSTAMGELLKYGIDNNLSKSFDYRNQLGQFGGLGAAPVQAGATAGLLGTKAQGGIYEALGSGFENLTNQFKLNKGFSF